MLRLLASEKTVMTPCGSPVSLSNGRRIRTQGASFLDRGVSFAPRMALSATRVGALTRKFARASRAHFAALVTHFSTEDAAQSALSRCVIVRHRRS
jgi:hypothetical protein